MKNLTQLILHQFKDKGVNIDSSKIDKTLYDVIAFMRKRFKKMTDQQVYEFGIRLKDWCKRNIIE